jgi:hypothetical protein
VAPKLLLTFDIRNRAAGMGAGGGRQSA